MKYYLLLYIIFICIQCNDIINIISDDYDEEEDLGEIDFFLDCQFTDQEILLLTPEELHDNGGWDLGKQFDFLQNIGDQNTLHRIFLSDEEFLQGYNQQFETPKVLKNEQQQYRPQLIDQISQFHKRQIECNYGGKLVKVIPSKSFVSDNYLHKDQLVFHKVLNENQQIPNIESIQDLSNLQKDFSYIIEGKNNWKFLEEYQPIYGTTEYFELQFGYGKKYQSTLFKKYQEQYQELLYGQKLWILLPSCLLNVLNQNLDYNNIIEFIDQGYLKINQLQIILQQPGEIIYIPENWYATTLNIDLNNQLLSIQNKAQDVIDNLNLKQQNQVYQQNINKPQQQADYIQPEGNNDTIGCKEYHIPCSLTKQELIDLMDENFKDNGGWDPNEIYSVLKNINFITKDVQKIELSDEEFLEGLDVDLDYPRIFKSKTHKYRPQIRDILHLFSKQYMLCSYSKRTVSLTPCFGSQKGKFIDVIFEDWLQQSDNEKKNITLEELQELEGNQFYNLFGGTRWPFVEQNYKGVWKNNKTQIEKLLGYGKSGSGVPFHKHGDVFNEVIYGQKLWFLAPPCHQFEYNNKGMSIKFLIEEKYKQDGIVVVLQQPGEVLYIPKFWYHSTLNIGETVCVASFHDVFDDMQEYQDINDCKLKELENQLKFDEQNKDLNNQQINNKKRMECDPQNIDDCWEI